MISICNCFRWREIDVEYLRDLKHQMKVKSEQNEVIVSFENRH